MRGKLILISGPSGVGKGTIRDNISFKDYVFSISSTTRSSREGEVDGREYNFINREEFSNKIENNEMLEYAEFVGNLYGTDKAVVNNLLDAGKNVLLEIECVGAMQVIEAFPECISIFILPPSLEELERRLTNRNTEDSDVIAKRIDKARGEIDLKDKYKFNIINDNIEQASKELNDLLVRETK